MELSGLPSEELVEIIKVRDVHIAQLETLVEDLQGQLDAAAKDMAEAMSGGSHAEAEELYAIIQAQEAALAEQRGIIETQSALITDLNKHMLQAEASHTAFLTQASSAPASASSTGPRSSRPVSHGSSGQISSTIVPRRKNNPTGPGVVPSTPGARSTGYISATPKPVLSSGRSSPGSQTSVSTSSGGVGGPSSMAGLCAVPNGSVLRGTTPRSRGTASQPNGVAERVGSGGSITSAGLGVRGPSPRSVPRAGSMGTSHRTREAMGGSLGSLGPPVLKQEA